MPGPLPDRPDLLQLSGIALRAWSDPEVRARPGGPTAYIYQAYYQALEAGTVAPLTLRPADVNPLSSWAASQARAARALDRSLAEVGRSGLDQALVAEHIAPDLDALVAGAPRGPQQLRIRYAVPALVGGIEQTLYFTHTPGLAAPETVMGLLDQLDASAAAYSDEYDVELAGTPGDISISSF